jgi:hypothetical protein
MTQHPVLPLIAYALLLQHPHPHPSSTTTAGTQTTETTNLNHLTSPPQHSHYNIILQDVSTNEIRASISWNHLYQQAITYLNTYETSSSSSTPTPTPTPPPTNTNLQRTIGLHIHSLQFIDSYTIYWSAGSRRRSSVVDGGNHVPHPYPTTLSTVSTPPPPPLLLIQTEQCLLFIHLGRTTTTTTTNTTTDTTGTSMALVGLCHERTLRTSVTPTVPPTLTTAVAVPVVPSSNALPLTATVLLIGCNDGTMKVLHYPTNTIVKRIKGLGKSDYVTQLLYANPYRNYNYSANYSTGTTTTLSSSSSASTPLHILTVTKKGYVYLMEIILHDPDDTVDSHNDKKKDTTLSSFTMDVLPPMARFHVASSSSLENKSQTDSTTTTDIMDHTLYQYDPHVDKFYWYVPSASLSSSVSSMPTTPSTMTTTSTTPQPTMYVWDLKQLFRNPSSASRKSPDTADSKATSSPMMKPEPTMTIRFPNIVTLTNHTPLQPTSANPSAGGTVTNDNNMSNPYSTPSKDDAFTKSAVNESNLATTQQQYYYDDQCSTVVIHQYEIDGTEWNCPYRIS